MILAKTAFTLQTKIEHPIIMAPMFLVSNLDMMKCAIDNGVMGVFPTLNYRKEGQLNDVCKTLLSYKTNKTGSYGVNLIVQKTNPLYQKHLEVCIANKVPFYITSLGNPQHVIEKAHAYGAKVYCDVTNLAHAEKAASKGCDGFIAVGQGAGGHAGPYPLALLVPALINKFPQIPVIAAGGVATGAGIVSMLALGASGVSVGTRFIASVEATVSNEYKKAIVDSKMDNVVLTEKLSGTPCNIINTTYAKKIGYHQNFFEKFLSNNPKTKKYFKMLVQVRGLKKLEQAVKPGNYNNLWCAGQTVELINDIKPCKQIILDMISEMREAKNELDDLFENTSN